MTMTQIAATPTLTCTTMRWMARSIGALTSRMRAIVAPMLPYCVCLPVASTMATPRPERTIVPARIRRISDDWSGVLWTGSDSPVNADSSTCSEAASQSVASAAMTSPSRTNKTSPGTTSTAGISQTRRSRNTLARGGASSLSRSSARSERHSRTPPTKKIGKTATAVTAASNRSPSIAYVPAAITSKSTIGSRTSRSSHAAGDEAERRGARSFGPTRATIAAASCEVRPPGERAENSAAAITPWLWPAIRRGW